MSKTHYKQPDTGSINPEFFWRDTCSPEIPIKPNKKYTVVVKNIKINKNGFTSSQDVPIEKHERMILE